MKIKINNKIKEMPSNSSLNDILELLNIDNSKTILSLNDNIIAHDEYSKTFCNENDAIDIFSFVGGG